MGHQVHEENHLSVQVVMDGVPKLALLDPTPTPVALAAEDTPLPAENFLIPMDSFTNPKGDPVRPGDPVHVTPHG